MAEAKDVIVESSSDSSCGAQCSRCTCSSECHTAIRVPPTLHMQQQQQQDMTCSTATLRLGAGAMIVAPSNLATPAKSAHIQSPSALSSTPFGASAIQRDAGTLEVVTADTAAHASLSPFAMVASPFSAAALAEEQTQAELHATSSLQHAKRGHSAPALQHSARLHGRSIRFVRCLGQGSLGHEVHLGEMYDGQQVAIKIAAPLAQPATSTQSPPSTSNSSPVFDSAQDLYSSNFLGAPCYNSSSEACSAASTSAPSPMEHEAAIAALLATHPHPNIVRYLGTAQLEGGGRTGEAAIVMELCTGGDLLKLIHAAHREGRRPVRRPGLVAPGSSPSSSSAAPSPPSPERRFFGSWRLRVDVLRGLARGLAHMHALGVVHGDVTSYNVLIGKGCEPKLCDFDRAHATRGPIARTGPPHSLLWQPAEHVLGSAPYDGMAADVHCFGIVVFEVVTLCVPHTAREDEAHEWDPSQLAVHCMSRLSDSASDPLELMPRSLQQLWPRLPSAMPAERQAQFFDGLTGLACACCAAEPANRPSMGEVVGRLEKLYHLLGAQRGATGLQSLQGRAC